MDSPPPRAPLPPLPRALAGFPWRREIYSAIYHIISMANLLAEKSDEQLGRPLNRNWNRALAHYNSMLLDNIDVWALGHDHPHGHRYTRGIASLEYELRSLVWDVRALRRSLFVEEGRLPPAEETRERLQMIWTRIAWICHYNTSRP